MHHGFAQPWRRATHISCCLEHASAGAGCARAGPHRAWRRAGRRRRGRRRRLGRGAQRLVAGARARAAGRRLRAAAQAAQQAARGPRRDGRRAVAGRRGRRGRHCRERAGRRLRARLRTGARMSRHEAGRSQGPLRCPARGAGPVRGTCRGRLAAGACHAARLGPARRAGEGRREGGAARTACPQGRAPRRLVQARPRSGGRCHAWHRRRTAGHAGWGPSEGARPGRGRAGVRAGPALLVRGRRRGLQARVRGNGRGRRAPVGVLRPGLHRARDGHAARVAQHDHQARAQQLRGRPDAPGSARDAGQGAWGGGGDRRAGRCSNSAGSNCRSIGAGGAPSRRQQGRRRPTAGRLPRVLLCICASARAMVRTCMQLATLPRTKSFTTLPATLRSGPRSALLDAGPRGGALKRVRSQARQEPLRTRLQG